MFPPRYSLRMIAPHLSFRSSPQRGCNSLKFAVCAALAAAALSFSGCASLNGRLKTSEVSLRPQRLTVLESHQSQLTGVKRLTVSVRKCPASLLAEETLRNELGAATNFELVASASKERTRDTLTVECTTAVERDGGALGASRPAAIGLVANLASSNEVVWSARYFYRDRDVSSDVMALKDRLEVGGGGVRFASLSELAQSGMHEIAQALGDARSAGLIRRE